MSTIPKPKPASIRELWTLITSLFIVGVSWGTLSVRLENLEARMDSYESQSLTILEELRRETNEIKLEQTKMAKDLEWIKKEFLQEE
jgi:uncharacterized membrane-anchored protein YhcB (DUF1043 family)